VLVQGELLLPVAVSVLTPRDGVPPLVVVDVPLVIPPPPVTPPLSRLSGRSLKGVVVDLLSEAVPFSRLGTPPPLRRRFGSSRSRGDSPMV
jgi:hypothetical protein